MLARLPSFQPFPPAPCPLTPPAPVPGQCLQLAQYRATNMLQDIYRRDHVVVQLLRPLVSAGCLLTSAVSPLYASNLLDGTPALPEPGFFDCLSPSSLVHGRMCVRACVHPQA